MNHELAEMVARHTSIVKLADGTRIRIRPIVPDDREQLGRAVENASPELRYRRFMAPVHRLTEAQLRYLTEIDYENHFAWIAFALDEPDEPGISVARYVRFADEPDAAEAAVAVLDAWQGKGLGTLMLEALALHALEHGIKRFRGTALASNGQIQALLRSLGATFSEARGGEINFDIDLPSHQAELRATPLYAAMRAAAEAPEPPFRHPLRP